MRGACAPLNFLFLDTLGYESALRISGHHYAALLVRRGHRVASISAPVSPLHHLARGGRGAIARRFEAHRGGFRPTPQGVEHYVPWTLLPVRQNWPLDRPAVLGLSAFFYRRDVLARLAALNFRPDVVSLQNLAYYPLVREFPGAVLQYRMTDRMDAFKDIPASLVRIEDRVLHEADIISVTSRQFLERLAPEDAGKALYAPNGVDVEHFQRPRPRPAAYAGISSPIAVYIGALRAWFDWELLLRTLRLSRGVHFVLISPDAPRADLLQEPNFSYLPGIPYEEVPAYYQHASVTIIPFENSPLVAPVNPIKMFESLAAGTPVVAREWDELRRLEAPIRLATNPGSMAAAIERAIAAKAGEAGAGAEFLARYSWSANLDRLLERIQAVDKMKKLPKA